MTRSKDMGIEEVIRGAYSALPKARESYEASKEQVDITKAAHAAAETEFSKKSEALEQANNKFEATLYESLSAAATLLESRGEKYAKDRSELESSVKADEEVIGIYEGLQSNEIKQNLGPMYKEAVNRQNLRAEYAKTVEASVVVKNNGKGLELYVSAHYDKQDTPLVNELLGKVGEAFIQSKANFEGPTDKKGIVSFKVDSDNASELRSLLHRIKPKGFEKAAVTYKFVEVSDPSDAIENFIHGMDVEAKYGLAVTTFYPKMDFHGGPIRTDMRDKARFVDTITLEAVLRSEGKPIGTYSQENAASVLAKELQSEFGEADDAVGKAQRVINQQIRKENLLSFDDAGESRISILGFENFMKHYVVSRKAAEYTGASIPMDELADWLSSSKERVMQLARKHRIDYSKSGSDKVTIASVKKYLGEVRCQGDRWLKRKESK